MSGKQQKKPPRPYLKSSHRIEIHKEKNAGEKTTRFLHDLSSYLISVGLERPKSKGKRAKPSPKEEDAKALIKSGARECYSSALPGGQEKPSIFIPNTKEFFPPLKPPKGKDSTRPIIGMHQIFRALNAVSSSDCKFTPLIAAVCIDSELLCTTAVTHIISLFALGSPCKFYVIPKLSKELAPVLNLSKVTVVGLVDGGEDAALKLVERLQSEFHPISVSKGMKGNSSAGGSTTSSITFAPPKLWTPIGKTNGKRRKKKKGKK